MTLEISQFKEFFSSLSGISRLNFEVWSEQGRVYSSESDGADTPATEEIRDLSARILDREAFQRVSSRKKIAMFGVPLGNGDGTVGSLIAWAPDSSSPNARDPEAMEGFLNELAALVQERWSSEDELDEMADQLTQNFEDLHLYGRIATQIKTLKFSRDMLQDLAEELVGNMGVDLAFAELPDRQEYNVQVGEEELRETIPDPQNFVIRLLYAMPERTSSLEEGYFIVNDSSQDPEYRGLHPSPYRFLAFKIQNEEELYGWLGLVSFNLEEIFQRSELGLLGSMAEQIAVVIANTDLYEDLERFVINVIKSLVNAIEAKDVYTRGHSERVNRYSMVMAERLGMTGELKNFLHWASILHDIGKIAIPEMILNKPSYLDDDEYNLIKSHPKKGYEILQPIEQLSGSLHGILYHHERYDGKGYPGRLKGEEIPVLARIIAIADTFDAITSDRAYRPAKSPREALEIMEQVAGTQFDPDLFELFKEICRKDFGFEKEEHHG